MKKFLAMFMTVAILGWSCEKYDDTALNNRIDGLEDRVSKIEQQLKTLNAGYEAISALVGSGLVTGFVEEGDSYTITVKNPDGTSKNYTLKKAEKGDKGDKGDTGAKGDTPKFTLGGPDATGYYWLVDGVEVKGPDGKRVYANGTNGTNGQPGENGENGQDGVTPHLAVAPEADGAPDFSGSDETAELHWWVSYDWDGNDAEATWEDLGVATGKAADVEITASFEDGVLTIMVNGEEQVSVNIANEMLVTLTVDGETVEAGDEIEVGEATEIVVSVGEKAKDFAIDAHVHSNDYTVAVNDDTITVTAVGKGTAKLFIDVINNGKFVKTWVALKPEPSIAQVSISFPQADEAGYLPVAYGTIRGTDGRVGIGGNVEASAFPNLPAEINVDMVVTLDQPASQDLTITLKEINGFPTEGLKLPESISISAGQTETTVTMTLVRSAFTGTEDYDACFTIEEANELAVLDSAYEEDGGVWFSIANNFTVPYPKMTVDMFDNPFDFNPAANTDPSAGNDNIGYGTLGMIDGKAETSMVTFWGNDSKAYENAVGSSAFWKYVYSYGVYLDVKIPNDVFFAAIKYQNSTYNAIPKTVKLGFVTDASADFPTGGSDLRTITGLDTQTSAWNFVSPFSNNAKQVAKVRFGAHATTDTDMLYNQPQKGLKIAEFQLMIMY